MTTQEARVRGGRSAPKMRWRPALAGIAVVVSVFVTLTAFAATASAAPTGEGTTTTVTATPKTSAKGDPVTYTALVKRPTGRDASRP